MWGLLVADQTIEEYRKVFDVNVRGVLLSMKCEIPEMLKVGGGAIVNTASVAGTNALPGVAVYVGSKHAVIGLTRGGRHGLCRPRNPSQFGGTRRYHD